MSARGWATRLYAAALHAFPRRHRAAYSAEMIDTFERQLSAHRQNGRIRALWFIVAASLNVVGAGLGERRRHRRLALAATAGVSSVDFRLAWRMLVRYPGLSLVSVFGLAVGMALAAGAFTIIYGMFNPRRAAAGRRTRRLDRDVSTPRRPTASRGSCTTSRAGGH